MSDEQDFLALAYKYSSMNKNEKIKNLKKYRLKPPRFNFPGESANEGFDINNPSEQSLNYSVVVSSVSEYAEDELEELVNIIPISKLEDNEKKAKQHNLCEKFMKTKFCKAL